MKLAIVVNELVAYKRSLGMRYESTAQLLGSFSNALGDMEIHDVAPAQVKAYLAGRGRLTSLWHKKHSALTLLYRFAMARGYVESAPLPTTIPKQPPPCSPYIFSVEEIRRLVLATDGFNTVRAGRMLLGSTLRVMILLLYGTGMRMGEALSLVLGDVDLPAYLLTVRDTKFFKSRLVPIGARLASELDAYRKERCRLNGPVDDQSPFFVTRRGKRIDRRCFQDNFRKLRVVARVQREATATYQPRLHDLRHTFAVHRLVAWYREGADVQRLLPYLSTYLGHINIAATQRYLSMTPELLSEASRRFENYAFAEVSHVG
jgi:site-specific recombinase XerD